MNYKKLGFNENVFSENAKEYKDELIRYEDKLEDIIYWVKSESIVLIEGPHNSGKTRIALDVIDNFKGKGKVIYVDLDRYDKEVDIAHLLIYSQSFFRRLLNKMPRDMILIVDNAYTMENDFYKRLQYFFDQGYLQSTVFIKKANAELELPQSIKSRIGNKKIMLDEINKDEAIEIMNNRLNDFMNEDQLEKVWNKTKNFSEFIKKCRDITDQYINDDRKRMDIKFIEKVLEK